MDTMDIFFFFKNASSFKFNGRAMIQCYTEYNKILNWKLYLSVNKPLKALVIKPIKN